MAEQQRRQKQPDDQREAVDDSADVEVTSTAGEEITDKIDDLLDEIDSVLEENAEEFVKNYVQKGGE